MIVDIDGFKKVNDKHGHQKGDSVLVSVAGLLKSNLRISDVIGRYGGEEFLIYLSDVETGFINAIAEKLRRLVESETRGRIPVTVSPARRGGGSGGKIGKEIEEDLRELIRKADQNLYQAKAAGKNTVVVTA